VIRMSWSELSPGRYQRPLGENEELIKLIGDRAHPIGREQWSVTATATCKFPDSQETKWSETLREAWKLLRFEHPSIASTATDNSLEYVVPDSSNLAKWVDETFFVVEDTDISADDLIANMKPGPFVTLHFLPHLWEVVLHASHWRTDGYGAFQLVNALFGALVSIIDHGPPSLSWGKEPIRLVPSVETALNLPTVSQPEIFAAARQYLATTVHLEGTVGMPYLGDLMTRPKGTRSVRLQLSQYTTKSLLSACEARRISLLAGVHAALAAVNFARTLVDSRKQHYTSTIRLSLRPYLPEPYNTPAVASGLFTGGYMFKVLSSQSWTEKANQYQAEYERGATKDFLLSRRQYAILALDGLRKTTQILNPTLSNIDISFVDGAEQLVSPVLETKDGPLEILRIGLGVETLSRQMLCFLWDFRGQVEFNLVFNEAYYDAASAAELLVTLQDILVTELLGE
jgi:hypothetical protein